MRIRNLMAPAVAIVLAAVASVPWVTAPSSAEQAEAAESVSFERYELPGPASNQEMRPVQPELQSIQPWISAVGASIGAMDLRDQGHSGDACSTDPRDDQVRIFPVPGSTGEPFTPFTLHPRGLRYDATMAPIGCVPTDLNQDGYQDVLVYYWGRSPVLFMNTGDADTPSARMFEPVELVEPMQVWNSTALNVADVDGDGNLDLMVGNYFPDGARVLDPSVDNDPRMEMQHSMGKARNAGANRLFLGSPTTSPGEVPEFTDVSERIPEESANSWTLAIGFQDLTADGLADAYVANDFGPDQLLVNSSTPGDVRLDVVRGTRNLYDPRSTVLGHDSFKGMGVAYSYEAGQELPRIFVSNITSPWALQESNFAFYPDGTPEDLAEGRVPYKEQSAELGLAHSGWSWDVKAVDLFNEGQDTLIQATGFIKGERDLWPRLQETAMGNDLILSHPEVWLRIEPGDDLSGHEEDRMWRETAGGKFSDVGAAAGFETEVSRGFAPADVDGDGRYDFSVARQWEDSHVYLNRSEAGPSATLRVVRPTADGGTTPLVGATVTLRDEDGYSRIAQIYPANGHSGVGDTNVHFGLPAEIADEPLTAEVTWIDDDGLQRQSFEVGQGYQTLEVR
ncbi:FG-GAP repeat domain-containing protein [Myceligenerans salitolerans]|uniref:CRTAC1 family protein n=1 Tax=Myceligenerans salitolerans TaxID=1230528 RepID=A0ABS3IGQ5_9MICO|nr:VCBS repeat-containing protein [Myceligenerans salitolerans]MBO0611237.1 CRTAC1 family protein [Myceligenerans salitolerans]